jgi:hypothetical protein
MNTTTTHAIGIAKALGRRGFTISSIQVRTPDGRTWAIDTTSTGGFRLFEIDRDAPRRGPQRARRHRWRHLGRRATSSTT